VIYGVIDRYITFLFFILIVLTLSLYIQDIYFPKGILIVQSAIIIIHGIDRKYIKVFGVIFYIFLILKFMFFDAEDSNLCNDTSYMIALEKLFHWHNLGTVELLGVVTILYITIRKLYLKGIERSAVK
jgi:hypothetical protein